MSSDETLFSKTDWHSVDRGQRQRLLEEVAKIDADRLLNTSVDDLCAYLVKQYTVNVPVLREDDIVVDQSETEIDISRDRSRDFGFGGGARTVKGTKIEIEVPFTGDGGVFSIQPTSWSSSLPRAEVRNGILVISFVGETLTAERIQSAIARTIGQIQQHLETLRRDASGLLAGLPRLASDAVEQRRAKLLADRNLVAGLGFKMKSRPDSSRTFAAPEVRRKIAAVLPKAASVPFKPEPVLLDLDYEHILGVIENMVHVMERSPSAFKTMNEEALRSHFLVQLNGHYEGQATGETFNYGGKTDILIRSSDQNIFIGECKYWGGPKILLETLDQILSYGGWRDTKVAVIVFNRNKDFTNVLSVIGETVQTHSNYKRLIKQRSETSFQYLFAHKDDANRELVLTVMAFNVPT